VTAITAERLGMRFGERVALRDVSFAVERGEAVALLGPNGAGKTTTVEILEGFLAPSEGSVRVLGADPRRGDRSRVGVVMQSTSLDGQLTVREAVSAFAAAYPRSRPVHEVLELVDLADEARTRIGRLSGGRRRRVDLALGIVGRPDVLFLDEPTAWLDPAARHRTWEVVARLRGEGATVLLTTHHMEEAERLADRLIVLAGGRVVADAAPGDLMAAAPCPACGRPSLEDAYLELTAC
jgi:ABC-2 type transport system ATP-binding protein